MVDFAKEQAIGVQRLSKRLGVSTDTIRRWFRQGLEKRKLGGKVFTSLEALNRFSGDEQQSVSSSAELSASMESLKRMGVNVSMEGSRDGHSQRIVSATA